MDWSSVECLNQSTTNSIANALKMVKSFSYWLEKKLVVLAITLCSVVILTFFFLLIPFGFYYEMLFLDIQRGESAIFCQV